jgi:short-subunit dehydrogenase
MMRTRAAKTPCGARDHYTVVTGSGGGIGRALAIRLSSAGEAVWLLDNDDDRLDETAAACLDVNEKVLSTRLDVTDFEAVDRFANALTGVGTVHALYNVAGVIHAGLLSDSHMADIQRVIAVDLLGTIAVSHALIPGLVRSGHGRLVNISSAFGLAAVPGYTAYCAAKFGIRGFTEALQEELAPAGVAVTAVYPGGVRTGIMRRATYGTTVDAQSVQDRFDRTVARTSAAAAAQNILDGVQAGRRRVLIGADSRAVDALVRVVGTRYQCLSRKMGMRQHQDEGDFGVQQMAPR